MYLNLIGVLDNDGYSLDFNSNIEPFHSEFRGIELNFHEGISVSGNIKNLRGTIEVYANIKGTVLTKCARCFNDTIYSFSFNLSDIVDRLREGDNGLVLEGTSLDLKDMAYKTVISELPTQILCDKDCKGLCPKCGTDLNITTCDCPD